MDRVETSSYAAVGAPSAIDLIDQLSRYEGPPEGFLVSLLAAQCRLAEASGGAILRMGEDGRAEPVAVQPALREGAMAPPWLAHAVESAPAVLSQGTTAVKPLRAPDDLYGAPAKRHLVMVPLRNAAGVRGLAAFALDTDDEEALVAGRERLELTVSLLSLYEMRLTLQDRQRNLLRLRRAVETLSAVNEHSRFVAAAMAMCNEVAAAWRCERVSLGFLKGRYVHLRALSHVEKFSREMKLVGDLESAMEECLDQDLEVVYPAGPEATYFSRSAGELSSRHGPTAVVSLPLRRGREPVAVLTVERGTDEPFSPSEIEVLRLTCDLCTPALASLHEHDRWIGARAAASARKGLSGVLGARHTWIKLAVVLVSTFLALVVFGKGTYRVGAPFVLESTRQQFIPAPFDGFIEQVYVLRGQPVVGAGGEPSWLFDADDIQDWPGLVESLRTSESLPAAKVRSLLDEPARKALQAASGGEDSPTARSAALKGLNLVLKSKSLYDPATWSDLAPSARRDDLLAALKAGTLSDSWLIELNRSLLAEGLAGRIAPGPTVLATMETSDLQWQLAEVRAERDAYLKQRDVAMSVGKTAEMQIALHQAERVAATIERLELKCRQARITSAISGRVIRGDLTREVGAPKRTGDLLFEVAPAEGLRAELLVPEDSIGDLKEGMAGRLATAGAPGQRVDFVIERIVPVADVVDGRNVFRTRVRLMSVLPEMRSGMEGAARVDVCRRSYGWLWSRRLVNWVRMKLWL